MARVHQVGRADLTDSRLQSGFVYLVAVMDWCSRDVLAWAVSITLDGPCCLEALEQALGQDQPEIFTTDQGAQFTSRAFTERLQNRGMAISRDGRGRTLDHVFVERLWRTVKDEEVYGRDYHRVRDARRGLTGYLGFYHEEWLHQALWATHPRGGVPRMGAEPSERARDNTSKRRPPNRTYVARTMV